LAAALLSCFALAAAYGADEAKKTESVTFNIKGMT
jgi:hypothetical protein